MSCSPVRGGERFPHGQTGHMTSSHSPVVSVVQIVKYAYTAHRALPPRTPTPLGCPLPPPPPDSEVTGKEGVSRTLGQSSLWSPGHLLERLFCCDIDGQAVPQLLCLKERQSKFWKPKPLSSFHMASTLGSAS